MSVYRVCHYGIVLTAESTLLWNCANCWIDTSVDRLTSLSETCWHWTVVFWKSIPSSSASSSPFLVVLTMMTMDVERHNLLSVVVFFSCYQIRQEQGSCEDCSKYCEYKGHHDGGQQADQEEGIPSHLRAGCHCVTAHFFVSLSDCLVVKPWKFVIFPV